MPFCLCHDVMTYYDEHHLAMHAIADILMNSLFLNQWFIFVQSFVSTILQYPCTSNHIETLSDHDYGMGSCLKHSDKSAYLFFGNVPPGRTGVLYSCLICNHNCLYSKSKPLNTEDCERFFWLSIERRH